jgi:large subunit ribosomal protein L10
MARPEKVAVVDEIKDRLENSGAVFVTEYRGLSVPQQQALRRSLRATGADYKVMKMSLARLAAEGAGKTDLLEWLQGPTALAFTDSDPVLAAKELKTFAAGNEFLVIKGGLLDGETLDQESFLKLADLEPREVLLAMFAGVLKAPLTKLAGLMSAVLRRPASAMQQLLDKKAAESPVAEEPAAPEESTAEGSADGCEGTAPGEEGAAEKSGEDASAEPATQKSAEEPAADESDEDASAEEPAAEKSAEDAAADESAAEKPAEDAAAEDSAADEPAAVEEPTVELSAEEASGSDGTKDDSED